MDKVSVIIPTWNRAATIVSAVNSALSQTFPVHEVLVCDDGSTDNSRELVLALGDGRVKWIDGERAGRPAIPRNTGIRESSGEWLAFLDSDDEWLPLKLEKQMAALADSCCKACCSNAYKVKPGSERTLFSACTGTTIGYNDLTESNAVICSSAVIHASIIEKIGLFPEQEMLKAIEDYAFWLRVSTQTDFVFLQEPLLLYLDSVDSIRVFEHDTWKQRRNIFSDFLKWASLNGVADKEKIKRAKDRYDTALRVTGAGVFERMYKRYLA